MAFILWQSMEELSYLLDLGSSPSFLERKSRAEQKLTIVEPILSNNPANMLSMVAGLEISSSVSKDSKGIYWFPFVCTAQSTNGGLSKKNGACPSGHPSSCFSPGDEEVTTC